MSRSISLTLIGLLIIGCAAFDPKLAYRNAYFKAYPQTDPAMRADIEQGRIKTGMTREQVLAAWGDPSNRVQYDDGTEMWTYRWYESDAISAFEKVTTLHFDRHGTLENISIIKMN